MILQSKTTGMYCKLIEEKDLTDLKIHDMANTPYFKFKNNCLNYIDLDSLKEYRIVEGINMYVVYDELTDSYRMRIIEHSNGHYDIIPFKEISKYYNIITQEDITIMNLNGENYGITKH